MRFFAALALIGLTAGVSHAQETLKPAIVQSVVRAAGLQARIMWMDATANLDNLDTREKVADVMERCRQANINTVVVDVKPLIGETLYPSQYATRLTTYRGKQYDPAYDLLATALEEGKKRGLAVYANVNVMSEGHKLVGRGLAYQKTDWQSVTYLPARSIVTPEGTFGVSPLLNEAPPPDGMSVYLPSSGGGRPVKPEETYTVVSDGRVQYTTPGSAVVDSPVPMPSNGFILVGVGSAGNWMAENLRPGMPVTWDITDRLVPILQAPTERISVFVNPIHPEARRHALNVIREVVEKYPVDGIVFDRMRYASLNNDFSDLSRRAFEEWAGVKIQNWPHDIFSYPADPTGEIVRGPYFEPWLEWRARVLRDFTAEAVRIVRSTRPDAKCAAYVGSWYPVYYGVGVNWAAEEYHAGYAWMTSNYHETGYADMMDWICTGTYYGEAFREGAIRAGRSPDATVEAAAALSNQVVRDATFVYASLNLPDYKSRPDQFIPSMQAAVQETQGVMLFDLVYVIQDDLWDEIAQTFPQPATAPHDVPELLQRIRHVREVLPDVAPAAPQAEDWRLVVPE